MSSFGFWSALCFKKIPLRLGKQFSSLGSATPWSSEQAGCMTLKFPRLTLPRGRSKTSARYASLCRDDAVKSSFAILVKFSHSRWPQSQHETRKVSVTPKTSERAPPRCIVAAPLGGSRFSPRLRGRGRATTSYGQITIAAPPRGGGNWYNQNASQQMPLFIRGGHLETGQASAAWREPCERHP